MNHIAIYDRLIIDTSVDTHVFGLDAETGETVWETQVLVYRENADMHGGGPPHRRRQGRIGPRLPAAGRARGVRGRRPRRP